MNIQKILFGTCLLALSFTLTGQEVLDTYLLKAAENNPGLKARFNEYLAALELVPQVKSLPDPEFAFGYFIQPVETRLGPQQFKISASQMFPWFGTLKARENSSIWIAKVKYEAFEEARSALFNDVRGLYYNLYFTKKAKDITLENLELLTSLRSIALIKVEAGQASAVDEFRIEIELGDLENQLALLNDEYYVLQVMFNNLLNADDNETVLLPDLLLGEDIKLSRQAIKDSILSGNHQLLSLEFQNQSLIFQRESAKKAGKPDFNVGVDYFIIGQGENNLSGKDAFVLPRIGITVPLYRNKYKAMVNELVFRETVNKQESLDRGNILESLLARSLKEYDDAERRALLYEKQAELADKSINILETEYSTYNVNFEEILRMERMLLRYRLGLEKARADRQAAVSYISYLMGK